MSILKVDITIVPLFFLISYSLVPKLKICPKYFLNKNYKPRHCVLKNSGWMVVVDGGHGG